MCSPYLLVHQRDATHADWPPKPKGSLEDDAASVFDRITPRHHDFFRMHLAAAFAGEEVECIVRSRGSKWAPVRHWSMLPIVDEGRIVSVELTCSGVISGDEQVLPWKSSLAEDCRLIEVA